MIGNVIVVGNAEAELGPIWREVLIAPSRRLR
jgi:hypothetical protein